MRRGTPDEDEVTDDACQDWMETHNKLVKATSEARIVASREFVAIAEDIHDFWLEWMEPILDGDVILTSKWHADEDTDEDEAPLRRLRELVGDATDQARKEVSG